MGERVGVHYEHRFPALKDVVNQCLEFEWGVGVGWGGVG